MREHRKRIVAGSHDHDAVATTGQLDQAVAASVTIWKGEGFSTTPFDLANDFSAANAAVDRAAEIYGLGHNQNVISVQPVRKAIHQGVLHQAHRAVAVRLKHQQQAAGKRVHGFERGRYLVGVVGKIVDHRYFICGAYDIKSPTDAAEPTQMGRGIYEGHAACLRDAQSGECVGNIVQPRNFQVHLDDLTGISRLH